MPRSSISPKHGKTTFPGIGNLLARRHYTSSRALLCQRAVEHALKHIDLGLLKILVEFDLVRTEVAIRKALRLAVGTGRTDLIDKLIRSVEGRKAITELYSKAFENLPTVDKSYLLHRSCSSCPKIHSHRAFFRKYWTTQSKDACRRVLCWTDHDLAVQRLGPGWKIILENDFHLTTKDYEKLNYVNYSKVISTSYLHHRLQFFFGIPAKKAVDTDRQTWTFTLYSRRGSKLRFENHKWTWKVDFRGNPVCSKRALHLLNHLFKDAKPMQCRGKTSTTNDRLPAFFEAMPAADRKQAFGLSGIQDNAVGFANTYRLKRFFQARLTCQGFPGTIPGIRSRESRVDQWTDKNLYMSDTSDILTFRKPSEEQGIYRAFDINKSISPPAFFERLNATFLNHYPKVSRVSDDGERADDGENTVVRMDLYFVGEILKSKVTFKATMDCITFSFSGTERAGLLLADLLQWLCGDNVAHPYDYMKLGHFWNNHDLWEWENTGTK